MPHAYQAPQDLFGAPSTMDMSPGRRHPPSHVPTEVLPQPLSPRTGRASVLKEGEETPLYEMLSSEPLQVMTMSIHSFLTLHHPKSSTTPAKKLCFCPETAHVHPFPALLEGDLGPQAHAHDALLRVGHGEHEGRHLELLILTAAAAHLHRLLLRGIVGADLTTCQALSGASRLVPSAFRITVKVNALALPSSYSY